MISSIQAFIPFRDPIFIAFLVPHVMAGLTCVLSGLIAMLSRKQKGRHSKAGKVYFWGLAVLAATASVLAFLHWAEDGYLFFLGMFSFFLAFLGRISVRSRWLGGFRPHLAAMGFSYIVLLIAFYMDNGKKLPLWRDLPTTAYWLVPLAAGTPIVFWALLRHPLVRAGIKSRKEIDPEQ